jgi:hypothetical protein
MYRSAFVTKGAPWNACDGKLEGMARVLDHDQTKRVAYESSDKTIERRRKQRGPALGVGLWSFEGKVRG